MKPITPTVDSKGRAWSPSPLDGAPSDLDPLIAPLTEGPAISQYNQAEDPASS